MQCLVNKGGIHLENPPLKVTYEGGRASRSILLNMELGDPKTPNSLLDVIAALILCVHQHWLSDDRLYYVFNEKV